MGALLTWPKRARTFRDVMAELGDIPPDRILLDPPPGTATEEDLLRNNEGDGFLCELVHGTLVEKAMGVEETKLEGWLLRQLFNYLDQHDIGEVMPGTGAIRFAKGIVRLPDISFFLWEHASSEDEDRENPIAKSVPNLVIEVVSRSNTPKELARKRKEYFKAGTSLVWQVYPRARTVEVYTSPGRFRTLGIDDTLDGGTLLPGFRLPLQILFGRPTKGSHRRKK